jgi:predicted DNA-binding transcriptional regulator AlpA
MPYASCVHHLVGAREVAAMLGLTRQRVTQLSKEDGWPEPEVVLTNGQPIWRTADIEDWARRDGREIRRLD